MINFKTCRPRIYVSSSGLEVDIKTMNTPYLENIIRKMQRDYNADELPESYQWLDQEYTLRKIRNSDPDMWVTKEGAVVLISKMETPHIQNIIALFEKYNVSDSTLETPPAQKITRLKAELLKREYLKKEN
ncbi:MAG: hypothetical protein H8E12_06280 [Rhodobacteraceae bacterium]|nr:hypothetical protein [Paracoccaceae bacterium]